MTTKKFGLTSYDEPAETAAGNKKTEIPEDEKFPFLRLEKGENRVRFITGSYKYWVVRFKANEEEKGWGKKIRVSLPLADDPAIKAMGGTKHAKERWLVGVLDRSDNQVRIFDYHVLVYKQIQKLHADSDYKDPQEYDIKIYYDPEAAVASQITLVPSPPKPLSQADVAMKDKVLEKLEKALGRHSAPLKPETVLTRMQECGWEEETTSTPTNGASTDAPVVVADDDEDYTFTAPTN